MKHKEFFLRLFISGTVIAFLLMSGEGKAGSEQAIPSEKSENDLKPLSFLQLGLRLAGTILGGDDYAYALIVEESTGNQNLYSVGESINGNTINKINKDSVELEREGIIHVLKITGDVDTEVYTSEITSLGGPPSITVPEKLPPFEPVVTESGPPSIGESKELPHFEPVIIGPDLSVVIPMDSEKRPSDE